jgi:hypothetical protein
MKEWVLVFLVMSAMSAAVLDESIYGVNEARLIREAEAAWVRDHHTIIYDHQDLENKYVSRMSQDQLIHALRHPRTREAVRLDEANLSAYLPEAEEPTVVPQGRYVSCFADRIYGSWVAFPGDVVQSYLRLNPWSSFSQNYCF